MKALKTVLIVLGSGMIVWIIVGGIMASFGWSKGYATYWNLSDKASTISQKSEYIDKFVDKLDKAGLYGTNAALFFQTDNSSFNFNMEALRSLQGRLQQIKGMDENSFAYQTAIQQITEQEQGQAQDMLSALRSCWMRVNHYFFWNELEILVVILVAIALIIVGAFIPTEDF